MVAPILYGPEHNQFINGDNYVIIAQQPAFITLVTFDIPATWEFAVCAYNQAAINRVANAEFYFERGNYSRSVEPWSHPAEVNTVAMAITGWYKAGVPDARKPWLQARTRQPTITETFDGNTRVLRQIVSFEDKPGNGYNAAHVTIEMRGSI